MVIGYVNCWFDFVNKSEYTNKWMGLIIGPASVCFLGISICQTTKIIELNANKYKYNKYNTQSIKWVHLFINMHYNNQTFRVFKLPMLHTQTMFD